MTRVLTIRISPDLLSRAEAKAVSLGLDRAKYVRSLIEEDLAEKDAQPKHKFASEDLIGSCTSGTPGQTATNARVREVIASGTWPSVKGIADTGLIVTALTRNDLYHDWATEVLRLHAPFHTCDAVLNEAASFFPDPVAVLQLVARGDLILDPAFVLADELPRILAFAAKYADRPMDLADACLVRMTELAERCKVWTVDRADFAAYRRHGRQPVPCEFPPD